MNKGFVSWYLQRDVHVDNDMRLSSFIDFHQGNLCFNLLF